jgi:CxxC motif-containing protein (DUF1111 family)
MRSNGWGNFPGGMAGKIVALARDCEENTPYEAAPADPSRGKVSPMNRAYRVWYLLFLVVALAPAGARLFLWQKVRSTPVDPAMAQAGKELFERDWKVKDPMCPEGDGLGPVFNATSCVACHHQGGPGGGGGLKHNVTTFTVRIPGQTPREGVVHAFGSEQAAETLRDVHPELPAISQPTLQELVALPGRANHCLRFPPGVHLSQRNTPALFGAKLIDEIPERVIAAGAKAQKVKWGMAPPDDEGVPVGRVSRLANGKLGRFGWKGQTASLSDFVRAACANELGLGNPAQAQPTPIYAKASLQKAGYDLTLRQCDEITAFCASLKRPVERLPNDVTAPQAAAGRKLFATIGCADCHTPKLGTVDGLYSDLLLHRMGQDLVGGGSYGEPPLPIPDSPGEGPSPSEWRTPPLWGVADSAPYLHDGRAATLEEAIKMHGGQGARSVGKFAALKREEQGAVIAFLKTLRAP